MWQVHQTVDEKKGLEDYRKDGEEDAWKANIPQRLTKYQRDQIGL